MGMPRCLGGMRQDHGNIEFCTSLKVGLGLANQSHRNRSEMLLGQLWSYLTCIQLQG